MASATNSDEYFKQVEAAAQFAAKLFGEPCALALVLGSGINSLIDALENKKEVSYEEMPNMPLTTVVGHHGRVAVGTLSGKRVLCFAGRVHAYEGYHAYQLAFNSRLMALMGVKTLIATNASGGAMKGMTPGCVMALRDHICFTRRNPLADLFNDPRWGPEQTDSSACYSTRILDIARTVSKTIDGFAFHEGVYGWTPGPTFETPTEVTCYTGLGADVFGMSTVPEVMAAVARGIEVFACALVTNLAAGISDTPLTHEEVGMEAKKAGPRFQSFIRALLSAMPDDPSKGIPPPRNPIVPNAKAPVPAIPLPTPELGPPSLAQITAAAEALTKALGGSVPVDVVNVGAGLGREVISGGNWGSTVLYSSLPGFHSVSVSGAKGGFAVWTPERGPDTPAGESSKPGTKGLGPVLVACGHSGLDLSPGEATWLAAVLAAAKVTRIIGLLPGAGTPGGPADTQSGGVFIASDVVTSRDSTPPSLVDPAARATYAPHWTARGTFAFQAAQPGGKTGFTSLMAFAPPTWPSKAEAKVAARSGAGGITVASTGLLVAGARHGIATGVICALAPADLSPFTVATVLSAARGLGSRLSSVLGRVLSSPAPPQPPVETKSATAKAPASSSALIVPRVAPKPHNDVGEVTAAAKAVASGLGASVGAAKVAVIVGNSVTRIGGGAGGLNGAKSVSLAGLPGAPADTPATLAGGPDAGSITLADGAWICRSPPGLIDVSTTPEGVASLGWIVRVLHALGAKTLVVVGAFVGLDAKLTGKAGDLVLIGDHYNFTGRNPLYGANELHWGTRFPDMSDGYNDSLQPAAIAAIKAADGVPAGREGPAAIKFAWVDEIVSPSLLLARQASVNRDGADAWAVGDDIAPFTMVAKHMSMDVVGLGVLLATVAAAGENGDDVALEVLAPEPREAAFAKLDVAWAHLAKGLGK